MLTIDNCRIVSKGAMYQGGGDCVTDNATATDAGYTLITDGSCLTQSTSSSADPKTGPLWGSGGETPTHLLLDGSPAIDAIPLAACSTSEDQRGVARPQNAACDNGALELGYFSICLPVAANNTP